ncbi:MAG: hypothetical protein JWQ11_2424 [Rhizobacter sp.]|nr:hypothetical protein [Rhizobacter sp.]
MSNEKIPSGTRSPNAPQGPATDHMEVTEQPDELQANIQADTGDGPAYDSPHRRNADFESGYGDGGGTGKGIVYGEAGSGAEKDPNAVLGTSDPKPGTKEPVAGATEHNQPSRRSAS